jgi:RNA polymerase sigma-70 factor (ECF subfamily)
MRRERRVPVVQAPEGVDLMDLAAEAEPSESIEDLVARKDLTALVEKAMARLPEEQRTAIVLKEYHGLTFQEIADLMGCPLSTVKTRLYQGLTVLRRELAAESAGAAKREAYDRHLHLSQRSR